MSSKSSWLHFCGVSVVCRQSMEGSFFTCHLQFVANHDWLSRVLATGYLEVAGAGACVHKGRDGKRIYEDRKGPLGASLVSPPLGQRNSPFQPPSWYPVCCERQQTAPPPSSLQTVQHTLQEVSTCLSVRLSCQWVAWRKGPGLFFSVSPLAVSTC